MTRPGNKRLRVAQNTNHGAGVNKDGRLSSIGRPINIMKVTNNCGLCPFNYIFRKIFFNGAEFWDNGIEIKVQGVNKNNGTGLDAAGIPNENRLPTIAGAGTDVNIFNYNGTSNNLDNRSVLKEFYRRLNYNINIKNAITTQAGTNRIKLESGINVYDAVTGTADTFLNQNSAPMLIWVQKQLYNFAWKKTFLRRWQILTQKINKDASFFNKDLKFDDIVLTNIVQELDTKLLVGGANVKNYSYLTKASIDLKISVRIDEYSNERFETLFQAENNGALIVNKTNEPENKDINNILVRQTANILRTFIPYGNLATNFGKENWFESFRYILKAIFKTGIDSVTTAEQKNILKQEFKAYISKLITNAKEANPYTFTGNTADFRPEALTATGTTVSFGVFSADTFGNTSEAKINSMIQLFVDIYTDKLWAIESNAANGSPIGNGENNTYIASGGNITTSVNQFYPVYNIMSKTGLYHRNFSNANTPIKENYQKNIDTMRKYSEIQSVKNALFMKMKREGPSQAQNRLAIQREKLEALRIKNTVKNFNLFNSNTLTRQFSNMNTITRDHLPTANGAMINMTKDAYYDIDVFNKPIHIKRFEALEKYQQNDVMVLSDNFIKELLMYDLNGDKQKLFSSDSIQSDLGVLYLALLNKDDPEFINREPKPKYILDSSGATHPDSVIFQQTKNNLINLRDEMFKVKYTAYASIIGPDHQEYTMTLYLCKNSSNDNIWYIKAGGDRKSRLKYIHIELVDNMTRKILDLSSVEFKVTDNISSDKYYETKTKLSSSLVFWEGLYTLGNDKTPSDIISFKYSGEGTPVFTNNTKIIFQYTTNPDAQNPVYLDATRPQQHWLENYPVDTLYNDFTLRTNDFEVKTEKMIIDTCYKFYFGNFSNVDEKGKKESRPIVNMNDFNEALLFSEIEVKRQQEVRKDRNKQILVELLTRFLTEHAKIAAAHKIMYPMVDNFNFEKDTVSFDSSRNLLTTVIGIPKSKWIEHKDLIQRNPHPKFPDETLNLMDVVAKGIGVGPNQDNDNFHLSVLLKEPIVDKYIEDIDYEYSTYKLEISPGIAVGAPPLDVSSIWFYPPTNIRNQSATEFYKADGEDITEYKTVIILTRPVYDASRNITNDYTQTTIDYFPKDDNKFHEYKSKNQLFSEFNLKYATQFENMTPVDYCEPNQVKYADDLLKLALKEIPEERRTERLNNAITNLNIAQVKKNSVHCETFKRWIEDMKKELDNLPIELWGVESQLNAKVSELTIDEGNWEKLYVSLNEMLLDASNNGYPITEQKGKYPLLSSVSVKLKEQKQKQLGTTSANKNLDISLNSLIDGYGNPNLETIDILKAEYDASLNNTYLIINKLKSSLEDNNNNNENLFQFGIKQINNNINYVKEQLKLYSNRLPTITIDKSNKFISDSNNYINLVAVNDYIKENTSIENNELERDPSNNLHLLKEGVPGQVISYLTIHALIRQINKKIEVVIDEYDNSLNKLELNVQSGEITEQLNNFTTQPFGNDNYPITFGLTTTITGEDLPISISYKNEIIKNIAKLDKTLEIGGDIIKGQINYKYENYNAIDNKWETAINRYGQVITFYNMMKFQNTGLSGSENKKAYDNLREQIKLYNVDQLSTDMPGLINKIEVLSHAKQLDSVGQEIATVIETFKQGEDDKIKALDTFSHKNSVWRSGYDIPANIDLSLNELIEKYDKMYNAIDSSVNETASGLGELYHLVQNNSITYDTLPTRFEYRNEGMLMRKLIQYLRVHEVLSLHENNHITTEPVKDVEKTLRDVFDKAVKYDLDTSTVESDKREVLKEIVDNAEMQVNLKIDHDLITSYNVPIEPNEKYLSSVESFNKYKGYQEGLWNPSKPAYSGITDGSNNPLDWNVKRVRIIQTKINEHKNYNSKTRILETNRPTIELFENKLNSIKDKYKIDITASSLEITTETEAGSIKKTYSVTDANPPPQKLKITEINREMATLNTLIPGLESLQYEALSTDSSKFGTKIIDGIEKAYSKEKLDEGKNIYNDWVKIEKVLTEERNKLDAAEEALTPDERLVRARNELQVALTQEKNARNELEDVENELEKFNIGEINQEISNVKKSVNDAISNIDTLKLEVVKEQEKFDPIKATNINLITDISNANAELLDISQSILSLETKQPLVNQELENIQKTVEERQIELSNAITNASNVDVLEKQQALTAAQVAVGTANANKNNAQTKVNNAQIALNKLDEEDRAGSDEETALTAAQLALNTDKDVLAGAQLALAQANTAFIADQTLDNIRLQAQANLNSINTSLTAKQTEKTETDTALAQAKEKKTAKNIELQELEAKLLESNTTLTKAETALNKAKENVTASETTKTEKDKELADLEKQLAIVKNLEARQTTLTTKLDTAKKLKQAAEQKVKDLTPEAPVTEQIPLRLDVQLPLDLNKTLSATLKYNTNEEKTKIKRKYLYTFTDPNSPEITIDETHHLGTDQNYAEILAVSQEISKTAVDLATNLKTSATWYNVLNKANVDGGQDFLGNTVTQERIGDQQKTIHDWVTVSLDKVNNKNKTAELYIQVNPQFPVGDGSFSQHRFGIDSLSIVLFTNMSLNITDDRFKISNKEITLVDTTTSFDPKGWWTKNLSDMIGYNGEKILIGTLRFQNLTENLSYKNAFDSIRVECGGNTTGLRYIVEYDVDGHTNRLFSPRKQQTRELNLSLLKNRGIMEQGYDITQVLGDYDGDGIPSSPKDSEEFYGAIAFKIPDERMIEYLANPNKNESVYNNIVKILGIKQRRLFLTPYVDENGEIIKNKDGTVKLKVHPDCKYGEKLNRALTDIIPVAPEEVWTEIDRLEFSVPENLSSDREKIYFVMQKSNLPEENPNCCRIFVSGDEEEKIITDDEGKITNREFKDTQKFYGAQFYLNKKIKENTFLFKDSLSADSDSSIKEINDTGRFGENTNVDETSVAFVKFKNNIGYNFAGVLGVFKVEDADKIDELKFLKEKSIATFRSNDLEEAAPAFGKVYPIGATRRYSLESGFVDLVVTDSHHAAVILHNNKDTTSFELNIYDEKERGARLGQCTLTGDKEEDLKEVQKIINNKELINPEYLPSTSILKEDLNENPNGGFRMVATCLKDDVSFSKSVYCGILRISSSKNKVAPDINDLKITSSNV